MSDREEAEPEVEPGLEIETLIEKNPEASAYYAFVELEAGRLGWLAEHIRRCNFRIDPLVAKKLLELLDGSHETFAVRTVRSKRLNPKAVSRLQKDTRPRVGA